ncbi:hypothetical protein HVA01_13210 [Halovibrio variabilis]|uniref:Uncharacterized protein n=1 Tax=Halovibrio variabilis TaxID=31910 RepID=A0A511UM23_9GAMM|nr:hypothetical protein HVA01_13210 [Halovibrio variabilis]
MIQTIEIGYCDSMISTQEMAKGYNVSHIVAYINKLGENNAGHPGEGQFERPGLID